MKILILSGDFPPQSSGGAGIVAFRLAKGLRKLGHDIFVITSVRDKSREKETVYEDLKIFNIYTSFHERWMAYLSLYNPQTVKKVRRIINEIKPDIVHAHAIHFYLSYHCLKIAKQSGAKVFLTAHDVMLFNFGKLMGPDLNYKISAWRQFKSLRFRYNPLRNTIIKYYLKYVDKIFAVSGALKKALSDNGIKNVEVIYNGIDAEEWLVKENSLLEFKNKFNLQNKKVIFFGGRLNWAKGAEAAVRALGFVVKKVPKAILFIAGTKNSFSDYMEKLAGELGVKDNLILAGWLSGDDLKAAYWLGEMAIFPSLCFETFGLVNLEAMACHKPVVATCFGGSPEIVRDNVTGYIVNPFETEVLAGKIIDLLIFPPKARKFGEEGYKLVKNKFSLDNQIKQTVFWYKKILRGVDFSPDNQADAYHQRGRYQFG